MKTKKEEKGRQRWKKKQGKEGGRRMIGRRRVRKCKRNRIIIIRIRIKRRIIVITITRIRLYTNHKQIMMQYIFVDCSFCFTLMASLVMRVPGTNCATKVFFSKYFSALVGSEQVGPAKGAPCFGLHVESGGGYRDVTDVTPDTGRHATWHKRWVSCWIAGKGRVIFDF